ncbi:hypothetical protein [Pelagicoccus sp. SDUM812002]|uniref:hypothetical protein n=1 Tax=Pelagicoccus sp. SDUM812002 TaxID=3041266 RepID=UPI0028101A0B|nr:hypothetical protein [Pelagicoccus sp. SDUM812002]MDQ8185007.1 hypothetical protein [Pelagicoccus sp. SDUM812002]
MRTSTLDNTIEGIVSPAPQERPKREKRASSSGFAKRVWKTDGGRLTDIATRPSGARFGLFN